MRVIFFERSSAYLSFEHLLADILKDRAHVIYQVLKFFGGLGVGRPIKIPVLREPRTNKFLRAVDLLDHVLIAQHNSHHAQILFELILRLFFRYFLGYRLCRVSQQKIKHSRRFYFFRAEKVVRREQIRQQLQIEPEIKIDRVERHV